jgi:hypothetical protein
MDESLDNNTDECEDDDIAPDFTVSFTIILYKSIWVCVSVPILGAISIVLTKLKS